VGHEGPVPQKPGGGQPQPKMVKKFVAKACQRWRKGIGERLMSKSAL